MINLWFQAFIPISIAIALAVPSTGHTSEKPARIDALAGAYHENGQLVGALIVAEAGEVIYKRAFGLANLEWSIPNTTSTRFLIGSTTKQFTAIMILRLAQAERLSLDDVITDHLPDYRRDTGSRVTIRQLLSHASGLPDYFTQDFFENHKDRFYPRDEFVRRFLSRDLAFEPGTDSRYSSANYYLLGLIIESVTGQAYAEAIRDTILEPLGMHDTGFDEHAVIEPQRASGYIRNFLGYWAPPFEIPESSAFAAGAMYSSVEDLYKFDRALYEGHLVARDFVEETLTKRGPIGWRPDVYFGYGSTLESFVTPHGERMLHQMAGNTTTGFTTVVSRLPEDGHLVAIATNAGPGYFNEGLHRLTDDILRVLYNEPVDVPKRFLEAHLGRVIMEQDILEAVRQFHELKDGDEYSTSDRRMNQLGYQLLRARRNDEAVTIFDLNVQENPDSANAIDSLAEGLAAAGRVDEAVRAYERVVEIAMDGPLKEGAIAKLVELRERMQ